MGFRKKPEPAQAKKTIILVANTTDGACKSLELTVTPSGTGFGVADAGGWNPRHVILYADGKCSWTNSWWRPHQGWTAEEIMAAGFAPPPRSPDRPEIENLALAVLAKDRDAYRKLVDAVLEELGG